MIDKKNKTSPQNDRIKENNSKRKLMKELEENIILKNSIDLANENTQISGNLNLEKKKLFL